MADNQTTPEIDVWVATFDFLCRRNVRLYEYSIASGKGIDFKSACSKATTAIKNKSDAGGQYLPKRSKFGPDIIGISEKEWWKVECKGTGAGKSSTQRNNFDRALASVVSYYREKPEELPEWHVHCNDARPYLGLALPASYLNELKKRVQQPLRKVLNLWILLYQPESKSIEPVSPEDNYRQFGTAT